MLMCLESLTYPRSMSLRTRPSLKGPAAEMTNLASILPLYIQCLALCLSHLLLIQKLNHKHFYFLDVVHSSENFIQSTYALSLVITMIISLVPSHSGVSCKSIILLVFYDFLWPPSLHGYTEGQFHSPPVYIVDEIKKS